MGADPYDIVAVVLGVLFTLRKLDVRQRQASDQPHVPAAEFERWRARASAAYGLGGYACLFRILFHFAYPRWASSHGLDETYYRRGGLIADALWLLALVVAFVRARAARNLRLRLGIRLDEPGPS